MLKIRKKCKTFIAAVATVLLSILFTAPCLAVTPRDAVESVVMVYEQFVTADEYGQPVSASGWGTGFAIGKVGRPIQYITTNFHVIKDAYETGGTVQVYFSAAANKYVQAEVYWKSEGKDLAILKLPEPTTERKAMVLCPMKKINLDDSFSALGYPFSSIAGNDFPKFDKSDISITKGGISKQTRVSEADCYLLDLAVSEGNSGGPLVNSKGEVVGVNSFYIQTQAGENAAAVKSNYAIAIDELIRSIDRDVIPITVSGELTGTTILLIVGGAVILTAAIMIVILILVKKRKKKAVPAAQSLPQTNASGAVPEPQQAVPSVTGLTGYFAGKTFQLEHNLVIGRDNNKCNLVFPVDHPGISGTHCVISAGEDGVYLTDLGSSYGTFLGGGVRLTANQRVKLHNGDLFYLADEENRFELRIG